MKRVLPRFEKNAASPTLLNQDVTTVISLFCQTFSRQVREIVKVSDDGYLQMLMSDKTMVYAYMDVDGDVQIELEEPTRLVIYSFHQQDNKWHFIGRTLYDIASQNTPACCQLEARICHQQQKVSNL